MMKLSGVNLLNNNLKEHKSFEMYDSEGIFARFDYSEELKRYQSKYGYLTIQSIIQISKDESDERYIRFI